MGKYFSYIKLYEMTGMTVTRGTVGRTDGMATSVGGTALFDREVNYNHAGTVNILFSLPESLRTRFTHLNGAQICFGTGKSVRWDSGAIFECRAKRDSVRLPVECFRRLRVGVILGKDTQKAPYERVWGERLEVQV